MEKKCKTEKGKEEVGLAASRSAQASQPSSRPSALLTGTPFFFASSRCPLDPACQPHTRLQCRLPHPRLNRLRDRRPTVVAGRARGHAQGMALSPWRHTHATLAPRLRHCTRAIGCHLLQNRPIYKNTSTMAIRNRSHYHT